MSSSPVVVRERAPHYAATQTATVSIAQLPAWLGATYQHVAQYLGAHHHYPSGPPFARYHRRADGQFDVTAGFPVGEQFAGDGDVVAEWIPGARVAVVQYVGSYEEMAPVYQALADWLDGHDAVALGEPYEVYRSNPNDDPAANRTDVVQPFRLNAQREQPGAADRLPPPSSDGA